LLVVLERDLRLEDGRTLRVYDGGGPEVADAFTVVWLHGSPQTGAPLEPLLSAAAGRGIRPDLPQHVDGVCDPAWLRHRAVGNADQVEAHVPRSPAGHP
jgi:hypothetical protein